LPTVVFLPETGGVAMKFQTVLVACTFLILVAIAADSQAYPRWRPPKLNPVTIDGTIERVVPGMILAVNDKDQRQWAITPERTTKILVVGTATLDFLKPKMLVQFNAQVDEKGVVKDKLGDLTIVTAATANQPAPPPTKSKGKTPGKPDKKSDPPAAADTSGGKVGSIMGVHGHKLSVKAGGKLMQIELTEEAKINISVDIAAWAAKGDKIQAKGKSASNNPGICYAEEVTITLAEPLTSGKKKIVAPKTDADSTAKAASTKKSDTADSSADSGDDAKPKKKKKPTGDDPFSAPNGKQ
jgi:hypothetical protein